MLSVSTCLHHNSLAMVEGKCKLEPHLDFSRRTGGKGYEEVAVVAMPEMQNTRKQKRFALSYEIYLLCATVHNTRVQFLLETNEV